MSTTTQTTTQTTTPTTARPGAEAALGAAATPRAQARLRRAMTMAALAAVLALAGAFGLQPRVAQATPRTLAVPEPAPRAATAAGSPAGGARPPPDTPPPPDAEAAPARGGKAVTGRLNLNTATAAQLMLLPGIGPAKAERVLLWRKRNGTFRRIVDLRRVKGFGYRTVKRLEPHLDIKGETTLRAAAATPS